MPHASCTSSQHNTTRIPEQSRLIARLPSNGFHDQEVNALTKALQHAELELADVQREPLRLLNMKAPFNCLPNEIISHILQCVVEDDNAEVHCYGHCAAEIRLIMSVCQLWRLVAISTPRIWNSFSVKNAIESHPQIDHINHHLDRSGAVPINLRIRDANIGGLSQFAQGPESSLRASVINCAGDFFLCVASVKCHLWRCRNLDINLQGTVAARDVLPLNGPLTNLQSLSLQFSDQVTSYIATENISLVDEGSSCRLRELRIRAKEIPPMLLQYINSKFITDLRFNISQVRGSSVPPQHLDDFILGCPAVETMMLEYNFPMGYHPTPRDISTPNLRVLHLTGYYMTPYLKSWNAPRLRELFIQNPMAGLETPTFQFPALESLALVDVFADRATDENFLFTILNNHPTLTTLATVNTHRDMAYLFKILLDTCPNLSTLALSIDCAMNLDSSVPSILALLEKRPQIHLNFTRNLNWDEVEDKILQDLQASHPERVFVAWVYQERSPIDFPTTFEFDWEEFEDLEDWYGPDDY